MEAKVTDRDIERLHFDAQGLVPAVIQDVDTKQVLMLGYMTKQMLAKTLETGRCGFGAGAAESRGSRALRAETT